jgi:16S rRNA (cytosine967-C5)-methyltransferase
MSANDTKSPRRIPPVLIRAVVQSLQQIFLENRYADKVIESILKNNPKFGSRDRGFVAETTYDLVRYYRLYAGRMGKDPQSPDDFEHLVELYLDRDPEAPLPDLPRAVRESIPDWLDELGAAELGSKWDDTIHELNQQARVVLRANRLKTDRTALQKELLLEGVVTEPEGDGDALVLDRRQNVFITKAFRNGLFEVQDFSSQLVSALLAPAPGMRVVDACAGGGGKALHLAALMANKGRLLALDTYAWKLDELKHRARRAGVSNIETRAIDTRKVIKRLYNSADRLLLDVPCSGLGVLRRNPDAKWKLKPEQLESLHVVQQEILQDYCPMVKPGGRIVYATCSILPSENQQQVAKFLKSDVGKGYVLLSEKTILPQDQGFDGFFMALLERKPV